jgi:hypothetical protein
MGFVPTTRRSHDHEAHHQAGHRAGAEGQAAADARSGHHRSAVPLSNLKGQTPGQTIYSVLYSQAKREDGLVIQTGKGEFKLNPKRRKA